MSCDGVFKQKKSCKTINLLSLAISHTKHRKSNEFFNTKLANYNEQLTINN